MFFDMGLNFAFMYHLESLGIITRGPWASALSLTTNLAMGQSSKSCTYTLSTQDVEIKHLFALWAVVSKIVVVVVVVVVFISSNCIIA